MCDDCGCKDLEEKQQCECGEDCECEEEECECGDEGCECEEGCC